MYGWGATCGCHKNENDKKNVVCKKAVKITSSRSYDEARIHVKRWLIYGAYMASDIEKARTFHLKADISDLGDMDEAELDEHVKTL